MFVQTMAVMTITGAILATLEAKFSTAMGGLMTLYFVITGVRTLRRGGARFERADLLATLFGLTLAVVTVTLGFAALASPIGRFQGNPPSMYFVFATFVTLAILGDLRVMFGPARPAARRMARHVWRMSFAMFVATGSFFLAKAKTFPQPIRIMPVLWLLALAPLLVMFYWLIRLRLPNGRWIDRVSFDRAATSQPPIGSQGVAYVHSTE
jgi:hypothetical protein